MKKFIVVLVALALLCFVGCGQNGSSANEQEGTKGPISEGTAGTQAAPDKETAGNGEITMDELMKAPESPVEDFEVMDFGNGVIRLESYLGNDEIVVIPESLGVTHIAKYTFANDCSVKAIRLSSSIMILEKSSFALNEKLELVVCGSGLEEIGEGVFQNCTNLREIKLNDGLVSIGAYALSGSKSLKRVEIPATVTELSDVAFYSVIDGFVIVGEAGSAAEEYAKADGITFKAK